MNIKRQYEFEGNRFKLWGSIKWCRNRNAFRNNGLTPHEENKTSRMINKLLLYDY